MEKSVFLNAGDFMQMLKEHGLVIGPKTVFEKGLVQNISLPELQERLLRKKLLSCSEISKGQLWGEIEQKRVYQIVKKLVPEGEQIIINNSIKIPVATVKSIAASRGIYF